MFTGIITDIGEIESVDALGDLRVRIRSDAELDSVAIGASIACSGVCLTVVDKGDRWFAVDVSEETRNRSAPDRWSPGQRLNLERALKVGDELGGHIVTGHVDGVGRVASVEPRGGSTRIVIENDAALAPFIAEKGSIAVDGVSLTVNEVDAGTEGDTGFAINLIPHSAESTTLGALAVGAGVNLEIDVLARYLGRMMDIRSRV